MTCSGIGVTKEPSNQNIQYRSPHIFIFYVLEDILESVHVVDSVVVSLEEPWHLGTILLGPVEGTHGLVGKLVVVFLEIPLKDVTIPRMSFDMKVIFSKSPCILVFYAALDHGIF